MTTAKLLNVKEVSEMLGISERTIYRLSDAGDMPRPVKLGASVRWRRRELENWVEDGCPKDCNVKKQKTSS
jgi:excisionase family DNA binding protein